MLPVDVLLIWKYSIKLPKHNFSKIDELKEILQKLLISISGRRAGDGTCSTVSAGSRHARAAPAV